LPVCHPGRTTGGKDANFPEFTGAGSRFGRLVENRATCRIVMQGRTTNWVPWCRPASAGSSEPLVPD